MPTGNARGIPRNADTRCDSDVCLDNLSDAEYSSSVVPV
jgi:hypothetical protein